MNKNKAFLNIITSTIFKLLLLIISILLRRYLLKYLGKEAVGLFSLYTSILGFLAIAELGVGAAITFSMYKPLVEKKYDEISGLYFLYKKIYNIIFLIFLIVGLTLTYFIPMIAKENSGTFNMHITYILFLLSTITTYLYAHKTSFINANLDNYITVTIRSIGVIIESIIQILVLIFIAKKDIRLGFTLFMLVILISNIFQGLFTNLIFNKKYRNKINNNKELNNEIKKEVTNKTKAMFSHKIGGLLVNTTDSLIISSFISVTVLGVYTNYITLSTGLVGILSLVFTSITSVIGHSYAKNTKEVFYRQFNYIYIINYILGFIFFLGFYAVIDDTILILFSKDNSLIMDGKIVLVITLNYFIQFMRRAVSTFKDSSGLFYNDRYKPLFEGVTNLVLSLILVRVWGVVGVLVATIITNIFITHIVEPYVLYKHGFNKNPKGYYLYNYIGIGLFVIAIIIFNMIPLKDFNNIYINFLVRGFLSVGISLLLLTTIYIFNRRFRESFNYLVKTSFNFISGKIKRK